MKQINLQKIFKYDVWTQEEQGCNTVLVLAETEDEAENKLSSYIEKGDDYDLTEDDSLDLCIDEDGYGIEGMYEAKIIY